MLESGSVSDFQGLWKKIDDEEEKWEVLSYFDERFGKKKKGINMEKLLENMKEKL